MIFLRIDHECHRLQLQPMDQQEINMPMNNSTERQDRQQLDVHHLHNRWFDAATVVVYLIMHQLITVLGAVSGRDVRVLICFVRRHEKFYV
jgi:hypothetical protein